MFTKGRILFALFFVIAFATAVVWSYRKDIKERANVFKGSKKTIAIIFTFLILFLGIIQLLKLV